ncbi:hypothetical protein DUQ59_26025 [Salmonella enterica subsp. enterica serovar Heidelberg]|nr:hypothetical protein [Salmonella enterica subsp. enterica serovar Heidelberg]
MGCGHFRHENRLAFFRSISGIIDYETLDAERNFMQQRLHCTGVIYQLICCAMIRPKKTGQDVQL